MGYSTNFKGILKFKNDVTAKQFQKLKTFMGEDCRDHPEWQATHMTYIDLKISDDFSGIEWDGSEKTYDLEDKVDFIIREMRKFFPDFELEGKLLAQGEDIEDRWELVAKGTVVSKILIVSTGQKVKCPHCEQFFFLN